MGDAQSPAQGKSDLDFYIRFARPLIFNLPDAQDRVLASAWVKKIKSKDAGSDKLRTDYIKLLLFALQRQKLVGIFADDPTGYEKLDEFPEEYDLNEMARLILNKEKLERIQRIRRQLRGRTGDYPPYSTDLSPDLREYAAAQDIPGFGVHCYYAISKDPVNTWLKADKGVFPKMAKSAVDTSGPTPPGMTLSDSCICKPGEDPEQPLGECKAMKDKHPPLKKKKNKKLGKSPPTSPLGKMPEPDDRAPPLWGSNLLEVRDIDNTEALPEPEVAPEIRDREEEAALMRDMGFAVADYMSGEIIKRGHKTKRKKKSQEQEQEAEGEGEGRGEMEGEGEEEESADAAKRREEIMQDAKLLEYFKGKLEKAQHKQKMTKFSEKIGAAVPASSGIPVTTPKPSTLPQRVPNSERLYSSQTPGASSLPPGEHLPPPPGPKPLPTGKDEPMFRMYENVQNAIEQDEQLKRILERAAHQQALLDMSDDVEAGGPSEGIDQEPPPEPIKPIQRGSPEAAGIIGDFMDSMNEQQPQPQPTKPPSFPPPQKQVDTKESPKKSKKQKKDGPQRLPKTQYQPSGSPGVDQQMQKILDRAAQQQAILDQEKFGSPDRQAFSRYADIFQGQGVMDESFDFPASPPCPLTYPSPQGGRLGPPMGTPPGAWLRDEQAPDFPPSPPPGSPPSPPMPRAERQHYFGGLVREREFDSERQLYKMKLRNELRKPLPPKPDLSPTEQKYIDYTFSRDPATRNLVTRVCKLITDVPQEVPDPSIPPQSPVQPLPAMGDVPRIADESINFPASPPPFSPYSPQRGQPGPQQPPPQQTPQRAPTGIPPPPGREGKPFPTPSTGAIPRRGMIPPPSRIPAPPSRSRIPAPPGRRPSLQRPPPAPESPLYPQTRGPPQTGPLPALYGPPQIAPSPPPCPGPPSVGGTPQPPGGYTPPRPSPRGPPSVGGTPQAPGVYTPPPPPFTISPVQFTPPLDSISPPDWGVSPRTPASTTPPGQMTPAPQAQTPCQQAFYETPTRAPAEGVQGRRRAEPYRFREEGQNARRRLSDIFYQVPAPDVFSDEVMARYPDLFSPPSPGTRPSRGPNIMDRPIDADLPSPMRPPAIVPGWQTPDHLRRPSGQDQQQWMNLPQPVSGVPPYAIDTRWDQMQASMPGEYLDDLTPPLFDDSMCIPECPEESGYPGYSQPPAPPNLSPYQSPQSPRTPPSRMQALPPMAPGGPSSFMTPSPCPALTQASRIQTPSPSPDHDRQVANMMDRLQDTSGAETIRRRRMVQPIKRRSTYQEPVLSPVIEVSPRGQTPCPSHGGSPQGVAYMSSQSPPWSPYRPDMMMESPPFMVSPQSDLMNESPPPDILSPEQFMSPGWTRRAAAGLNPNRRVGGTAEFNATGTEFGDFPPAGGRKVIPRDETGRPYLDADTCQPCTPQEAAAARQQMQQMQQIQQVQQQQKMQQIRGQRGPQPRNGRPACGARSRQRSPSRQAESQQPIGPERVAHQNASQVRLVTVMPPKQPDPQGECPDTC